MARFLASWHKLPGVYACRVTKLIKSRIVLMFIVILLTALVQCRVTNKQRRQRLVMLQKAYLRAQERSQGGAFIRVML